LKFAFLIFSFSTQLIFASILSLDSSYGLQQVAGPIIVEIKPGETRYFYWGLLTDKNQSNTVNLTADGTGAEYLAIPKSVILDPGNLTYVQGNITIPAVVPAGIELKPSIHALEVGENVSAGSNIVNVQMSKILTVKIGQNASILVEK
jgi:hypothetical protein